MSDIRVGHSTLGNKIYAGTLIKGDTMWSSNKTDVTIEAIVAVCNHVAQFGDDVVISKEDGTPEFKIKVERM
jgi:hypothetical protein